MCVRGCVWKGGVRIVGQSPAKMPRINEWRRWVLVKGGGPKKMYYEYTSTTKQV